METTTITKKVKLNLVGLDGNAYSIMSAWRRQALKEKWTTEEIDSVLTKARSGDYDNLLGTIMTYVK